MSSLERHTDYGSTGLSESEILRDPMAQFAAWLSAAEAAEIFEPNAMVVSTVDADGTPSSRTVLLKSQDQNSSKNDSKVLHNTTYLCKNDAEILCKSYEGLRACPLFKEKTVGETGWHPESTANLAKDISR